MKYVILIHSNPVPWGHPTSDFIAEYQALPKAEQDRLGAAFDDVLAETSERGELLSGLALAAPQAATIYRWSAGTQLVTDGPYAETKEHLAGFFLIDVESRERAEAIAAKFSGPGETVELRPAMAPGSEDG